MPVASMHLVERKGGKAHRREMGRLKVWSTQCQDLGQQVLTGRSKWHRKALEISTANCQMRREGGDWEAISCGVREASSCRSSKTATHEPRVDNTSHQRDHRMPRQAKTERTDVRLYTCQVLMFGNCDSAAATARGSPSLMAFVE